MIHRLPKAQQIDAGVSATYEYYGRCMYSTGIAQWAC